MQSDQGYSHSNAIFPRKGTHSATTQISNGPAWLSLTFPLKRGCEVPVELWLTS